MIQFSDLQYVFAIFKFLSKYANIFFLLFKPLLQFIGYLIHPIRKHILLICLLGFITYKICNAVFAKQKPVDVSAITVEKKIRYVSPSRPAVSPSHTTLLSGDTTNIATAHDSQLHEPTISVEQPRAIHTPVATDKNGNFVLNPASAMQLQQQLSQVENLLQVMLTPQSKPSATKQKRGANASSQQQQLLQQRIDRKSVV